MRPTLAVLLFAQLVCQLSGAEVNGLQLRSSAEVDGSGIYLSALVEALPAGLPAIRLAKAPTAGQIVTLTRAQILESLRTLHPALVTNLWTGATTVRVNRRSRMMGEAELKEMLTSVLQRESVRDRGELELRFTTPWNPVAVADEAWTIRVLDLPTQGVSPNFILRFELKCGGETIGPWQIPLQARVWREVWVANSGVQRGQLLKDADLTQERRDLLTVRDPVLRLPGEELAVELAENIPTGVPLTSRSFRLRPVIQRGAVVDAVVQESSMLITVKVEALENGAPGQTVRVRNIKSKREFRGKVQNAETILVAL